MTSRATPASRLPQETSINAPLLIMAVSGLLALYLAGLMLGLAPASRQEMALIKEISESPQASRPKVAAALRVVQESRYVSKNNFQLVSDAFMTAQ